MTPIKVEIEGVKFGGYYTTKNDMITVTGPTGRTKTSQTSATPDQLAQTILSEIVREAMSIVPDGLETIEIELEHD